MFHKSPYDRQEQTDTLSFGTVIGLSMALHALVVVLGIFVLPNLFPAGEFIDPRDVMMIQMEGGMAVASKKEIKGPDEPLSKGAPVPGKQDVTPPKTEPTPPQEATPAEVSPKVPEQTDVIPLGKEEIKKPELEKKAEKPPEVTPEKPKEEVKPKEPVKPKPQTKPKKPSSDEEINKALRDIERKQKAAEADAQIGDAVSALAQKHGATDINIAGGAGGMGGLDPNSTGPPSQGVVLPPEKLAYYQKVREIVTQNWLNVGNDASGAKDVYFLLRIEPDGRVSSITLKQSSGNRDYDSSMERAIQASILPPLPPIFNGIPDNPTLRFKPR